MAKKPNQHIIVGLDIGTSKVVAIVSEVTPDNQLEVIGIGSHPSTGLKRGVVVNIESTVQSIQRAVEEAELMAGVEIGTVYTGIAGSHISSLNSHGIVAIENSEVSRRDIERVIDAAKAVPIPADQRILHVLPQEFIIDNEPGIKVPMGMSGVRLEAKVHMVTGAVSAAQNIVKCVRRCGLEVADIILEQLASSYSVLHEDEKELGVCLVDIGGGTTDIAIFTNGAIRHTAVIPIAGDQVTNDIAVALRIPTQEAESVKLQYGSVIPELASERDVIDVPGMSARAGRKLSSKEVAEVMGARYEELFTLIKNEVRRTGFEGEIAAGYVITGGASKVVGASELAAKVFGEAPVRLGLPQHVTGLPEVIRNPIYSTGVGLLLFAKEQQIDGRAQYQLNQTSGVKRLWSRMREWFQGNF